MYYIFLKLFLENRDALIALPTEIKLIIIASIIVMIVSGIIRKAVKLLTTAAFLAACYFICTYIGLI